MLPVALAFGTAWAVRGQFGHEYGATWAAAIGILVLLAVSNREDWFKRLPVIVVLGALAWGSGGMISYGKVVGYGFAPDFLNTGYGLLMLAIIGGLYGFIGGGITGLALSASPDKKVDWAGLFTQMVAGGYLFYGFFINQLEWLMTPPRSELWAACMGAALALGWYLYRNGFSAALRVAFFSSLGAGFGFGFGNFLQRMGYSSGIKFNWWNVMEYSIGFFGGLGIAYGVFSNSKWPVSVKADKMSNNVAWVFLVMVLPVINLLNVVTQKKLMTTGKGINLEDPAAFAVNWQMAMWIMSLSFMLMSMYFFRSAVQNGFTRRKTTGFTLLFLIWYIIISNVVNAIWLVPEFSSQHLYWLNLVVIGILLWKKDSLPIGYAEAVLQPRRFKWWYWPVVVIVTMLILSYIAVSIDYTHPNAQLRFE